MKILIGTYRQDIAIMERCLDSLRRHVRDFETHKLIFIDDSPGRDENAEWAKYIEPLGKHVWRAADLQPWGFAGAMLTATRYMNFWHTTVGSDDYFVWWEEDFTLDRDVDFRDLAQVLQSDTRISQLALARQPLYEPEIEAGGVPQYLGAIEQATFLYPPIMVQDKVFTTNPAVWAPSAYVDEWPVTPGSEAAKTMELRVDGLSFGFWDEGKQYVTHHGELKQGQGY
jgi:hypothetical protein